MLKAELPSRMMLPPLLTDPSVPPLPRIALSVFVVIVSVPPTCRLPIFPPPPTDTAADAVSDPLTFSVATLSRFMASIDRCNSAGGDGPSRGARRQGSYGSSGEATEKIAPARGRASHRQRTSVERPIHGHASVDLKVGARAVGDRLDHAAVDDEGATRVHRDLVDSYCGRDVDGVTAANRDRVGGRRRRKGRRGPVAHDERSPRRSSNTQFPDATVRKQSVAASRANIVVVPLPALAIAVKYAVVVLCSQQQMSCRRTFRPRRRAWESRRYGDEWSVPWSSFGRSW